MGGGTRARRGLVLARVPERGKGVVAGTDGRASSLDIRATFDGILGTPVAFGRTTYRGALPRRLGPPPGRAAFKPFIGCIPAPDAGRNTIAAQVHADRAAARLTREFSSPLTPGPQKVVTLCVPHGRDARRQLERDRVHDAGAAAPWVATRVRVKAQIVNGQVAAVDLRERGLCRVARER